MTILVTLDAETANPHCDVTKVGAAVYWEHPDTELLCLCAVSPGYEFSWVPGQNDGVVDQLRGAVLNPEVEFEAHASAFEWYCWQWLMRRYGLPPVPLERWHCTMAQSFARGLPGGLEKAAAAIGSTELKDTEGSKLTIALSKPLTVAEWERQRPADWADTKVAWKAKFPGGFDRSPTTIKRVVDYCLQDCRAEAELSRYTGPLSPYERQVWLLDQKIQQRGVMIDRQYIAACKSIVAQGSAKLASEFMSITGLGPGQIEKLRCWANDRGAGLDSLGKDVLKARGIVGLDDDDEIIRASDLSVEVHRALSIRAVLGSSSIGKLDAMSRAAGLDDRIRYSTQYHAAGTGRWGGRLHQPQNFPRGKIEGGHDPAQLVKAILTRNADYVSALFGEPIAAVASGLRHAMVSAPGKLFCVGDFAGIEARVVLALAGQSDQAQRLHKIGSGAYIETAEDIFNVPRGTWSGTPEKVKAFKEQDVARYTIGKNTFLACGFQMGPETFQNRYCPDQPFEFAEKAIRYYREDLAPRVPVLWRALEDAAVKAVYTPGVVGEAFGHEYEVVGPWLACRLPDGQTMWYYDPHPCTGKYGAPAWNYLAWKDGQWKRKQAYGGHLTENVVQKLARGLLCEAMFRLEKEGFPLVLSVHDEHVAEVEEQRADHKLFEQIMAEPTLFSKSINLPIAVEGWAGPVYKK